jgi:hypothetical protein
MLGGFDENGNSKIFRIDESFFVSKNLIVAELVRQVEFLV